ncbi:MAG TPA: threonine synthase [Devosiaceae bacterium]|nr:threonine synthase [Devosiaceae bacterium]
MRYLSTRGRAPSLGFDEAVLAGLASDAGLYVPEQWPQVTAAEIAGFANVPFAEVARRVIPPFVGGAMPAADLDAIIDTAWRGFSHPSVTPLVEIEPGHFVLELFRGPTLSFKDVAMQFLGPLMDALLAARERRATIVVATSGDTGSAAIEAFAGRERVDVVVLHPEGRVSEVQRRQMTTVAEANVHNVALKGSFDDCQRLVKAMFGNVPFRDEVALSGVNSINWGRIVAQTVYYFKAAADLGAPHRPVAFTVPTGNFGDVFSGYAATRMGLPVARLVVATNANDILARALETGRYDTAPVQPTISPSMDIQVSSNFERLLFEATGRDAPAVSRMMNGLAQSGGFAIPDAALAGIRRDFAASSASEAATRAVIADLFKRSGYLADPHTAVGVAVARRHLAPDIAMITLATAHPAKFPDAVAASAGISPPLPPALADLHERPERVTVLANDQDAVERFVAQHTRARRSA